MAEIARAEQAHRVEGARLAVEADRSHTIAQVALNTMDQEMRVEAYRLDQEAKHAEQIKQGEFHMIETDKQV